MTADPVAVAELVDADQISDGGLQVGGVSIEQYRASTWTSNAPAGRVFGGYDFWLGPEWSLGVQGAAGFVGTAQLHDDNRTDTEYRLGAVALGVEATLLYH